MKTIVVLLAVLFSFSSVQADLVPEGDWVYDTVSNVSWLRDANYALTTGYSQTLNNPSGVGSYGLMTFA